MDERNCFGDRCARTKSPPANDERMSIAWIGRISLLSHPIPFIRSSYDIRMYAEASIFEFGVFSDDSMHTLRLARTPKTKFAHLFKIA